MKRAILYSSALLLSVSLLYLIYILILLSFGNVHVVIPQQVIRSAQLTPKKLQQVYDQYHIRSIIDVAPMNKLHPAELTFSKQHHIQHADLYLHAHGKCAPSDLLKLTQLILQLPRPLLVHCHQGADRTGLASAVSLILQGDQNQRAIAHQYSFIYGAVSPTSVGKMTISPYFSWLSQQHEKSSKQHFSTWLQQIQKKNAKPSTAS